MTFNFVPSPVARVLGGSALVGAMALALGCAPAGSPGPSPIASVHRHQCGRCHAPPEPQERTKTYLQEAASRHQRRVHLTEDEWAAMVAYLAAGKS